jgi:hypothetical protein
MLEIVVDAPESVVVDNKVKPPLDAAAHFNPVASELSATNLIQEQSQRIVLGA